jgi:hypothetical protein
VGDEPGDEGDEPNSLKVIRPRARRPESLNRDPIVARVLAGQPFPFPRPARQIVVLAPWRVRLFAGERIIIW